MSDAETIRKRAGMYVGDVRNGSAVVFMVEEILANALDEHLAGCCSRISVELAADGAIAVADDGRGIPLGLAEQALTTFHSTPTLDGHAPHEHVGGHGLGLFPVCALSSRLQLQVERDGRRFSQRFERGVAASAPTDEGPASRTGTRIAFTPDPAIFGQRWQNLIRIAERLREISFLLPSLELSFRDLRQPVFKEPRGLLGYLDRDAADLASEAWVFSALGELNQISVEVAARWSPRQETSIESFANIERTTHGGTHVKGLLDGLVGALRKEAPLPCQGRSRSELERAVSAGLSAVVCVRLRDPSYGEPTKDRLDTPGARAAVKSRVGDAFATFLQAEPKLLEHFVRALAR
jgi:DNA gyrase subunit B